MKKSLSMIELENLAVSQWGLFTTAQAQELGVRRNQVSRMVNSGKIEPIGYGAYRFATGEETSSTGVKAAWLSVYPKELAFERLKKRPLDAIVSDRTAAAMHGVGDFYASPYTFAVNRRKQTNREDMRYLQRPVDEVDVVFIDELPVTSIERTVYDLIKSHEDPDLVDKFMSDASRKKGHIFNRDRLSQLLAPLAFRNGFRKNDGESFAADLIARNAANIQLENAGKMLARTLSSVYDRIELLGEQEIQSTLLLTLASAFKDCREATDRLISDDPYETLRERLETLKDVVPFTEADVSSSIVVPRAASIVSASQNKECSRQEASPPSAATTDETIKTRCGEKPDQKDNDDE